MTKVQSGYLLAGIGGAVNLLGKALLHLTGKPQSVFAAAVGFAVMYGSLVLVIFGLVRLTAGLFAKPDPSVSAGSEAMPSPAQPDPKPAAGNALATAALVCGIASWVVLPLLPAIPAVVYGSVALSRIRKSAGLLPGRGQALAGLILGVGGVLFPLVELLLVFR